MTSYDEVKAAVHTLVAQGVPPSRKRVRAALGDVGSYETLGPLIDRAKAELGLARDDADVDAPPVLAGYTLPEPDPARVQEHLTRLAGETAYRAVLSHLQTVLAACQAAGPVLHPGVTWLHRRTGLDLGLNLYALEQALAAVAPPVRHTVQQFAHVTQQGDPHG